MEVTKITKMLPAYGLPILGWAMIALMVGLLIDDHYKEPNKDWAAGEGGKIMLDHIPVVNMSAVMLAIAKEDQGGTISSEMLHRIPGGVQAARDLSTAFKATGFAVVVGHGMAPEAVEQLRAASHNFFASPSDVKSKYDKGNGYGIAGYVSHTESGPHSMGDFSEPGRSDLVESLTVSTKLASSSPGTAPSAEVEGDVPPELVSPVKQFAAAFRNLERGLALVLMSTVGATQQELDTIAEQGKPRVCLAYSPAGPPEAAVLYGQTRPGAHIDAGSINVLSLDTAGSTGLLVDVGPGAGNLSTPETSRHWVEVPYVKDALVLNVGALLSRWTNLRWRAAVHRSAKADASREHVSVVASAMVARADGPPFGSFASVIGADGGFPPIRAADFIAGQDAFHPAEYVAGGQLHTIEKLAEESLMKNVQK